jgi:hypothetical protein
MSIRRQGSLESLESWRVRVWAVPLVRPAIVAIVFMMLTACGGFAHKSGPQYRDEICEPATKAFDAGMAGGPSAQSEYDRLMASALAAAKAYAADYPDSDEAKRALKAVNALDDLIIGAGAGQELRQGFVDLASICGVE